MESLEKKVLKTVCANLTKITTSYSPTSFDEAEALLDTNKRLIADSIAMIKTLIDEDESEEKGPIKL